MAVLDRAGAALAAERELTPPALGAWSTPGEQARVGLADEELLREVLEPDPAGVRRRAGRPGLRRPARGGRARGTTRRGARRDRAAWRSDGRLAYPLTVKGRLAGVLEVPASVRRRDRAAIALLATLASQLSITLENARLYRELGTLFRQYMSPDVAAALLADPDQAALGGGWSR